MDFKSRWAGAGAVPNKLRKTFKAKQSLPAFIHSKYMHNIGALQDSMGWPQAMARGLFKMVAYGCR